MIPFIFSNDGSLTVFAQDGQLVFASTHPKMVEVKEALKGGDLDTLRKLAEPAVVVNKYVTENSKPGHVAELRDGVVYYNGVQVHDNVADRIISLWENDLPFEPMLRFLENLMQNPSITAREELFTFLSHKNLPITEDGHFLAYKRVRDDWKDFHSGLVDWSIGKKPKMPRSEVSDRREVACHKGLHVGAMEYVSSFNSGGHVIVVKVNPRDVVSVPLDCGCTKLRCCLAESLYEYKGDLTKPLYTDKGTDYVPPPDEDEDEYEDDDDVYCPRCGDWSDWRDELCLNCEAEEEDY